MKRSDGWKGESGNGCGCLGKGEVMGLGVEIESVPVSQA